MFMTSKKMAAAVLAITVAMSLSACSNWSKRDRNTAIGAGAGGVRRRSVNGRQYIRHPGRRGGRRRDWSPGWKIIQTFKY
ncbi:osmotically inducible lipoprotein B [Salmonella enterica subsp. enterica]|uniref:Osmotically inducible lipoprotein B n=1 Tax=Salmonella enterica I TaxID=59201 RepID=A0A3S4F3G7_SALET|nr:osmotically inducible lipoprotein B [Salmonella enterica subsp. enterica]